MPKVSVIMSVYNGERFLKEAIDSILNQTFKDFEFIIINDASTDKTLKILERYFEKDTKIVLVSNDKNLGLTKSINKGIGLAKGEYIARQDADDISLPTRLEKQVAFLDNNLNVGLLGTSIYCINEKGKIIKEEKLLTRNEQLKEALLIDNQFVHSSAMFRKKCIEKIGFYREEFKSAQDYDLWLRISEHFEIANLNEFLCSWRVNRFGISMREREQQIMCHNLGKELAEERKKYGFDRLQKGEKIDIPEFVISRRKSAARLYFDSAWALYKKEKYFVSLIYILKAIFYDPFNKVQSSFLIDNFFIKGIKKIKRLSCQKSV